MKATHNGTCQACGRVQAVNVRTGKLASHGYTVDWGYFNGTCSGAGHLPLETHHGHTDATITKLGEFATKMEAETLDSIEWVVINMRKRVDGYIQNVQVKVSSLEDMKQHYTKGRLWEGAYDEAKERQLAAYHRSARDARVHATDLGKLKADTFGKDLQPRDNGEKVDRVRFEVMGYGPAAEKKKELEAEGYKVRTRRINMSSFNCSVIGTRAKV